MSEDSHKFMCVLGLEPKFHEAGTFGGFGKHGPDRQTDPQDSCFIIESDIKYINIIRY